MPEPIQTPVPAADELAAQVLLLAQSRLTADLRFLSSALEQLKPIPVPALDTLFAGDGRCLYYCPETLLRTFRAQQSVPTRALLHVTLHFLLGHPFQRQEMDHRLWSLACDIAAEEVIRELEIPSCALPDDAAQDSWRSRLQDACPHLTAEAIYNFLLERQYPADVLAELTQLFPGTAMRSGMLRHGLALVRPPTDSCCPPGRMRISPTRPSCAKPTPGTKRCSRCSSGRRKPCADNGSSWPAKPRPIWRPSAAVTASVPEH